VGGIKIKMIQKLNNFPSIYWISLADVKERQDRMNRIFQTLNLPNHKMIEAYDGRIFDYTQPNDTVSGIYFHQMKSGEIATVMSHLKAIKYWYYTTDEDFAVFMEDDMNLEMSEYWGFTWNELISSMPQNWKSLQMNLIKESDNPVKTSDIKFSRRIWQNWGAGCYAISRSYAKELLDRFCRGNQFYLIIEDRRELIPLIENVLFLSAKDDAYTFPIFVEEVEIKTTFYPHFISTTSKPFQQDSAKTVLDWWKTEGKNKTLKDLMKEN
jgi:GR25 family glycosyltransferase involved in LPS biosynthesis